MSHPIPLTLAQISIRQDDQGRYCLNDLHKAAGGLAKHKPSEWLRNKNTQALVAVLESEARISAFNSESSGREFPLRNDDPTKREFPLGVVQNKAGIPALSSVQKIGTFIIKELVYAYAMWISPEFHIQVIRAYDALVTGALDEFEQHLNESYQYRIQNEKYWLNRYPHWVEIRAHVLSGERYRDIAAALSYSVGRVVRAVKSMIRVGLLSPSKVAEVQHGASKRAALRQTAGWGQLALALEGGAA